MYSLKEIRELLKRITITLLGKQFVIRCEIDNKYDAGRIFIQVTYIAKCNKTKEEKEWRGRKFYLSDHMTNDEIVKTAYTAFKSVIEHETMEGFMIDNIVLFNPHINFEELLKISNLEVKREEKL